MNVHERLVREFLEHMDPSSTGLVTYFQIVHALSNNMQKDWVGLISETQQRRAGGQLRVNNTVMAAFLARDHLN